jgi:hypothetical protein
MIADPIRLAFGSFQPADGGPPLGPDEAAPIPGGEMSFDDVLKGLNPLHHLPVVGTIYRAATGETIHPVFRVLGGALFGGVPGMLVGAVMAMIEETRPGAAMLAVLQGEGHDEPMRLAEARLAYGMQGNGNG